MTEVEEQSAIGRRRALARQTKNVSYETKREEIARAAARVFKRRGLTGASLVRIAEELGTPRATLYYYFGSKEELFDSVVTEVVHGNTRVAERIRDSEDPAPEKLRKLIVSLMESFEENYPFLYVYLQENLSHVPSTRETWAKRMQAVNRRYERVVQDIVEQGIREGTIRQLSTPTVMTFGIMGIVNWTNRWFDPDRSTVDATEIGTAYAEMVINGMRTE